MRGRDAPNAGAEVATPTTELVGRKDELDAVDRYVRQLVEGAPELPAALLIQGPAGIGKTALWLAGVERARRAGISVLSARPAEVESTFGYGALHDLLRDVMPRLTAILPAQQRRPIKVALGVGDESDGPAIAVDAHLVQAATANGILALAAEAPVLIAIDDAVWLDPPSSAVMEFVARRIGARRIGFIVTQRADEELPAPFGLDTGLPNRDVQRMWLEPLSLGALHLLLADRLGLTLPRPHMVQLHALSSGIPFHALEIARALRQRPLPPTGAPLPIPASLRELLVARAAALPAEARDLLLLVGLAGTLDRTTVGALVPNGTAEIALTRGVDEGFLAAEGDTVRAAHPLVASAVREAATPAQLRAAHALLAEVAAEPDARARHRALAVTGSDEQVAAELESAGGQARQRGAPEAASELLRLSIDRTPAADAASVWRRSVALADALLAAADLPAARELLDTVLPGLPLGRELAKARMQRAEIEWYTGTAKDAVAQLEAGLPAAEGHPDLQADIHYRLAIFYNWDTVKSHEHAERAVELAEGSDRPSLLSSALFTLFGCEVWLGLPPRTELLERGLAIEPDDNPDATTVPGIWSLALDRADDARRRFESMLAKDRARGDLTGEADLLTRLAEVELFSDNFATARELADAATAAARQQGSELADPARRVRVLVDIHQGRHEPARGIADAAYRRAAEDDDHVMAMAWLVALALLAASEADHVAVEHYTVLNDGHLAALKAVEALRLSTRHERPEALVALDRLDEAEAVLATLDEQNARIPRPWMRAAIARGRAHLLAARGDLDAAVKATDDVLAAPPPGLRTFDRARTLLARGQVLRRARARREAAAALDDSARLFDEIGAPVWATRARAEGERLGRVRVAAEGLTPTELQVASLAASGLTSRAVAEQLSISPKTVEAHLARSYAKLGIRSRAELGRLMAGRTPDEAGAA